MKGIENVSLVREQSSPAVFLIVGTTKFWIVDPFEFSALGFDWSKVRVVRVATPGISQSKTRAPSLAYEISRIGYADPIE